MKVSLPPNFKLRVTHITDAQALTAFQLDRRVPPAMVTVADIIHVIPDAPGYIYAQGIARCNPSDAPSKKVGGQLAVERALVEFVERRREFDRMWTHVGVPVIRLGEGRVTFEMQHNTDKSLWRLVVQELATPGVSGEEVENEDHAVTRELAVFELAPTGLIGLLQIIETLTTFAKVVERNRA